VSGVSGRVVYAWAAVILHYLAPSIVCPSAVRRRKAAEVAGARRRGAGRNICRSAQLAEVAAPTKFVRVTVQAPQAVALARRRDRAVIEQLELQDSGCTGALRGPPVGYLPLFGLVTVTEGQPPRLDKGHGGAGGGLEGALGGRSRRRDCGSSRAFA
jgi:hypothetical protein